MTEQALAVLAKLKTGPQSGRDLNASDPKVAEALDYLAALNYVELTLTRSLSRSAQIAGASITHCGLAYLADNELE